MARLALSDCARALGAAFDGEDVELAGVGIDTRTLEPGALYVAIRGERFDGHDFVAEAERAGARAVLASRAVETALPVLRTDDTRRALGRLASARLARLGTPVVAITGSNGKTTLKELLAAILGEVGPTLATRGNLNNELGVPLTLLRLAPEHRYAVVEMGANAPGEIARLAAIAPPAVGVITNIGPAHLEGFGSLAGVARAKTELYAALDAEGIAVINADDAFADTLRERAAHCRRLEFGRAARDGVRPLEGDERGAAAPDALVVALPGGGRLTARLALVGEHNRANALAAIAAAQALDVPDDAIVAGIERARAAPGRLETRTLPGGATLIDDSYNANPASTGAALTVLAARGGRRHLVLGDMAELGTEAETLHARIGADVHEAGIEGFWTLGVLAAHAGRAWRDAAARAGSSASDDERDGTAVDARGGHFDDATALARALAARLDGDSTVLVKGSRGARMERVVEALETALGREGAVGSDGGSGGRASGSGTGPAVAEAVSSDAVAPSGGAPDDVAPNGDAPSAAVANTLAAMASGVCP